MKKFFSLFLIAFLGLELFAAETKYISPNNDGVQDELSVNFRVKDKGKIFSWALVIEDAQGKKIRTIGNKVALPTVFNMKNFLKQAKAKKSSVDVPPVVVWNGVMDNGQTAPDGEYSYYITATDDSDNTTKTAPSYVIVDNTVPAVQLSVLPEGQRIFGEGEKITFKFGQNGSREDKWTATIQDANGKVVRNYTWQNDAPQSFEWNGTDDNGIIVQDGVYKYSITATDRAGNTNPTTEVANIIFSAEKPATNIILVGSKYFSVPEKSKINSVTLDVTIPQPRAGSGNALVGWGVEVVDKNGNIVRAYKGGKGSVPPQQIIFEGKNQNGAQIPDGEYFARVTAEYLNGYKTPVVNSPVFVFDTNAPSAAITKYDDIFSPDGDGNKDFFALAQTAQKDVGAPVRNWQAKIVKAGTSQSVYEYDFGSNLPPSIVWNGVDKNGKICADGEYDYELNVQDFAGNSFSVKTKTPFTLDTSKTEVLLAESDRFFNPNTKSQTYNVLLKSGSINEYKFKILNSDSKVVYSKEAKGKIDKIVWNGKTLDGVLCPDGEYRAEIETVSLNGSHARAESMPVTIDTVAPFVEVEIAETYHIHDYPQGYAIFSPDGDGRRDTLKVVTTNSTDEDEWHAEIVDSKGSVVKTFEWNGYLGGKKNSGFEWDGSTDNGNKASDGNYVLIINSVDKAHNLFSEKIGGIVLDSRATTAYVTAALPGISPISTTGLTSQKFDIRLSLPDAGGDDVTISSWTFDVENSAGKSVRSFTKSGVVPTQIIWDGKDENGKDCEGNFNGRLTVTYYKGNYVEAKTSPFICSVTPPVLSVKTAPQFFSPDNDGTDDDCFITLNGKTTSKFANWSFTINYPESTGKKTAFWKTAGAEKITPQITWDGLSNTSREKDGKAERVQSAMDYPYTFTATDSLGMTSTVSGIIPVDILVIRDGNNLKMAVPSIIFRSNAADFKTADEAAGSKVTKEQAANNVRVLKRVAEVLKKFPDYTVTVVGHANRTGAPNEDDILLSLSGARAEFVKNWLVKNGGLPEKRLGSEGKGAKEPVAAFSDTENWWKNRRVEFILHK